MLLKLPLRLSLLLLWGLLLLLLFLLLLLLLVLVLLLLLLLLFHPAKSQQVQKGGWFQGEFLERVFAIGGLLNQWGRDYHSGPNTHLLLLKLLSISWSVAGAKL